MSAYSTRKITRKKAEEYMWEIMKKEMNPFSHFSDKELESRLNKYVYSEKYDDILPCLINFKIINQ